MSDPSSAPPPLPSQLAPDAPGIPARHEHTLALEAQRSWKRKRTVDFLKLSPAGMELHVEGVLRAPLVMPLGAIATAIAELGAARAMAVEGRFPILRRLTATTVVPREEGVEGWLWTSLGGSAFPTLCEEDEAPNCAIVFAGPLAHDIVTRCFEPAFVAGLAARSPLGEPAVYGLLMRFNDVLHAQNTLRKFNLSNPLTDREVGPMLRRSLPTDVSADPAVRSTDSARAARAARSVAPPGLA
jgi:hypothetical protein